MSWSLQAGIIFFSTPNSSFIFDRRRLSMTLWAVFLAILLPAWPVELGCFFPMALRVFDEPRAPVWRVFAGVGSVINGASCTVCCVLGVI